MPAVLPPVRTKPTAGGRVILGSSGQDVLLRVGEIEGGALVRFWPLWETSREGWGWGWG